MRTRAMRFLPFGILCLIVIGSRSSTRADQSAGGGRMGQIEHLKNFQVIEFRRYALKEGEREHFAQYFEAFFPEAFQQIGALAFGQFFERDNPTAFTWIRGFKDADGRGTGNAAFYYGPLWKEHAPAMNDLLIDSDNVLLLRPLSPARGIPILPAVDPVREAGGATGVVVAQVFAIKTGSVDAFAAQAEATFTGYRSAGVHDAGVLVTLEGRNTFPQHPVRTDGPYLVWLGIMKDDQTLRTRFRPLAERAMQPLRDTGLLRSAPELIVLDPTKRSRLRWLSEWGQ